MNNTKLTFLSLALFLVFSQTAPAADWPQFKLDAARSAHATGDSLTFPMQRVMAVKFSAPIAASAAVAGGRVYAVDERGLLACIDRASHTVLWWAEIGGVSNRSSPAVANGKVFVGSTAGYLMVLSADSGREIARIPADGGVIAAPAVANNAVYCLSFNGTMLKADLSGKLVWSYKYPSVRAANQEFMVKSDTLVYWAGPYDSTGVGEPYAIHIIKDLGDSIRPVFIIRRDASVGGWYVTPWPQYWLDLGLKKPASACCGGGWGFVAFGDARPRAKNCIVGVVHDNSFNAGVATDVDGAVNFYALNSAPSGSKPIYSFPTSRMGLSNGIVTATAAISDGVVYVGCDDGILYGLGHAASDVPVISVTTPVTPDRPGERLTGHEWPTVGGDMSYSAISPDTSIRPPFQVYWKTRIAGVNGYNFVTAAAGKVFTVSTAGFVEALDAESGEILWRTAHVGVNGSNGPPTYAEGKVMVLRTSGLWCHDAETGALLWHNAQPREEAFGIGGAPQSDGMVVRQGRVLVTWWESGDSIVTAALDIATGREVWRVQRHGFYPPLPDTLLGATSTKHRVCQGALGEGVWFISGVVLNAKNWNEPFAGSTMAIDPATGQEIWKTSDYFIKSQYAGVNFRKGTLVLWGSLGGGYKPQALDAQTGQLLWQCGQQVQHLAPLTDAFLANQGKSGTTRAGYCMDPVWANGFFFGPAAQSSNSNLAAKTAAGLELWRYIPISRGCNAAVPAYGRLYYASNGEGVVYCFRNPNTGSSRAETRSQLSNSRTRAYPNPFNPATALSFYVSSKGMVSVDIFDVQGSLVRRIVNKAMTPGNHKAVWNGRDDRNRPVAAGLYLCKIMTINKTEKIKLLLIK